MKVKILFIIACLGIIAGLLSFISYRITPKALPPIAVSYDPYPNGIYASGIIESVQTYGSNAVVYPEISGTVVKIFANDGKPVKAGDPLIAIDDSVQREVVAKDKAQAEAAAVVLAELRAQPRPENLAISQAQLDYAKANLVNVMMQLAKLQNSYRSDPQSVSKNDLDNAINNVKIAKESLNVAQKQYNLVKAGAWFYDIQTQERQYNALVKAYRADLALLEKYIVRATADGMVLSMDTSVGSYISPAGMYDSYTQTYKPVAVMGTVSNDLQVRCYVDEILVPKLPSVPNLKATLMVRGETNVSFPLEFVRIQPLTIPNIQLSYAKSERVDVRVLPIIFKLKKPTSVNLFPGQLVDVYLKGKK